MSKYRQRTQYAKNAVSDEKKFKKLKNFISYLIFRILSPLSIFWLACQWGNKNMKTQCNSTSSYYYVINIILLHLKSFWGCHFKREHHYLFKAKSVRTMSSSLLKDDSWIRKDEDEYEVVEWVQLLHNSNMEREKKETHIRKEADYFGCDFNLLFICCPLLLRQPRSKLWLICPLPIQIHW